MYETFEVAQTIYALTGGDAEAVLQFVVMLYVVQTYYGHVLSGTK